MSRKKISEIEGGEEEPGRNAGFQTGNLHDYQNVVDNAATSRISSP
jgi:hypothetical protein